MFDALNCARPDLQLAAFALNDLRLLRGRLGFSSLSVDAVNFDVDLFKQFLTHYAFKVAS